MTNQEQPPQQPAQPEGEALRPPPQPLRTVQAEGAPPAAGIGPEPPGAKAAAALSREPSLDFAWNVHEYINEYIRFADAKAGAVIAFASALIAALYAAGLHKQVLTKPLSESGWFGVLAVAAFLLLGTGVLLAGYAIRPRLINRQSQGFVFWGSILGYGTSTDLWRAFQNQAEEHLTEHLVHHLHTLAHVCDRKYFWVGVSMWCTFVGGLVGTLVLIVRDAGP